MMGLRDNPADEVGGDDDDYDDDNGCSQFNVSGQW